MKKLTVKAFTLIEMLVVLLIISILILLFVPNLTKQKEAVKNTGQAAIVKVVESQGELWSLDHSGTPTVSALVTAGNITQKQANEYNDYYTKNPTEHREIGG